MRAEQFLYFNNSPPPPLVAQAVIRSKAVVLLFVDFLFIVTPIMGVCNCSMLCCSLLYVHSSIAIILMGKRELVDLLNLSSWCLLMFEWPFAVPWGCLRFVIVVFFDHTRLLFFICWIQPLHFAQYVLLHPLS